MPTRTADARRQLQRRYAPTDVVVFHDPADAELVGDMPLLEGKAAAAQGPGPLFFVCRDYACDAPTEDLAEVLES